ncbi:alpha/beta fold hydrolase [Microbacterium candidum]
MSDDFDEFSFLAAQAASIGVDGPLPRGERLNLALPDGRTLSALRYGPTGTEAPVVTFLHGAGLNAHTWDTTILAMGVPALAIDLAGHGDSSWREDAAYVPRVLAPDVVAALRAWTDAPQVLVGQSLGALTAAAVAASTPELVREVVLIDITPGIDQNGNAAQLLAFFAGPTDWATRDDLVDKALAFGLGGSRDAATRGVYLNSRVRPDGRVEWKHHFAHLAAAAANAGPSTSSGTGQNDAISAVLAETGWDDLAAIASPITFIRGDHGYVTGAEAEEFSRRVPTASIVVVPTGHNVQEEIPSDLGRLLAEHVAQP